MSEAIRYTLIATSLSFLFVAIFYRIRSQRSGESLDRTKEGWPILIGVRLAGFLTAGSTAAWLSKAAWVEPTGVPVPEVLRWLGVVGFGLAASWVIWMFHTLGRNLTDTVVTRRDAIFVDNGPYRFVRNPMYTGVLMVGLSLGLAVGTWLIPLCAGLIFTLLALRTATEEKYLIQRFGNRYIEYMSRVGRFFPRLRHG
ncbi:MAG: isoprenylcysteine carboxylmethyltransferase family protein [Bryobacteraceae bacterium]|nr:isoprenylcysteine carboxylmethyltransferase family protein [Bryobacteraceae bacterium]